MPVPGHSGHGYGVRLQVEALMCLPRHSLTHCCCDEVDAVETSTCAGARGAGDGRSYLGNWLSDVTSAEGQGDELNFNDNGVRGPASTRVPYIRAMIIGLFSTGARIASLEGFEIEEAEVLQNT